MFLPVLVNKKIYFIQKFYRWVIESLVVQKVDLVLLSRKSFVSMEVEVISRVEYIWLDGAKPTQKMRSKTRILQVKPGAEKRDLSEFPIWSFDGSSTYQSSGDVSDLQLLPVRCVKDPIRGDNSYLVLCEVMNNDGTPHESNTRSRLRSVLEISQDDYEPWIGYEQEYTLFSGRNPLGWPDNGFPKPQGPFYCGVGSDEVFGRELVEDHTKACMDAGIAIYGINAEVMPGQWEFQIGYRGFEGEDLDILAFSDHLWIARWLLCRVAERYEVTVHFDNKPVKGDWNGAGCHTNFSTKQMRDKKTGIETINAAIDALSSKHMEHVSVYGAGLNERLTGLHETCPIDEFRSGVADRGASIRIPMQVKETGAGYLEDRRPGANCDPYLVAARLITTICELDESWFIELKKSAKNLKVVKKVV